MNAPARFRHAVVPASLLIGSILLLAQQTAPAKKALVVNGRTVPDAVIQINGHYYADIDAIAEATQGALRILPERVELTLPGEAAHLPPPQAPQPQAKERITREFARAALNHLSQMREWKDAVIGMIKSGKPAESKLDEFRDRAVESLRVASISASTNSDQNALQLLRNEFAYMQQWDTSAMAANRAMSGEQAVNPEFPERDSMVNRITGCHSFLNSMIVSGVFSDSQLCH